MYVQLLCGTYLSIRKEGEKKELMYLLLGAIYFMASPDLHFLSVSNLQDRITADNQVDGTTTVLLLLKVGF
jgi:hypothetical protein